MRIHSSGEKYIAWCCKLHIEDKEKCSIQFIREDDLEIAFVTMINKLIFAHKLILKPLIESLRGVNKANSISRINELEEWMKENLKRRQTLVTLMSKGYLESAVFNKETNELISEFDELQKQKDRLSYDINGEFTKTEEVGKLYKFVQKAEMLTSFDEDVFKK
ncbi:MAG: zinc ribbon domain-containing protein [Lachnospirales bacterium]